MTTERTTAPSIDPGAYNRAVVISTGRSVIASEKRQTAYDFLPPGLLTSGAGWLLDQVAPMFRGEGVLVLPALPRQYTEAHPDQWAALSAFMADAAAKGWRSSDAALHHESGWITFVAGSRQAGDERAVHLCVLSHHRADPTGLIDPADSPDVIAERLAQFHAATGVAFRAMPGVPALAMLREQYARPGQRGAKRPEPRWRLWGVPDGLRGAGRCIWHRTPTAAERAQLVHAFDIKAQYLAAAMNAELAWSNLEPTGARTFEPTAAGYWQIVVPTGAWWARANAGRPPVITPSQVARNRTAWVTTPALAYLSEIGERPEVVDSWTCEHSSRILRGWAERLRDAITFHAADRRLAAALKGAYTQAIGLMHTKGGLVERPDWADTIIDLARVNMLRKLDKVHSHDGVWPMRVNVDCVWYADEHPDPMVIGAPLGAGAGIGKFRHDATQTHAEYVAAHKPRRRTK